MLVPRAGGTCAAACCITAARSLGDHRYALRDIALGYATSTIFAQPLPLIKVLLLTISSRAIAGQPCLRCRYHFRRNRHAVATVSTSRPASAPPGTGPQDDHYRGSHVLRYIIGDLPGGCARVIALRLSRASGAGGLSGAALLGREFALLDCTGPLSRLVPPRGQVWASGLSAPATVW